MHATSEMTATRREFLSLVSKALAVTVGSSSVAKAQTSAKAIKVVVFDAFAVFDPRSVFAAVESHFPGRGSELSATWRTKQFEYCWLRTLEQSYVDFWQVTEEALAFAARAAGLELRAETRQKLMSTYLQLEPWPDAIAALKAMREAGLRLGYVSNFTPNMMEANTRRAGAINLFEHRLSTDLVKAFKPDPRAYRMAEQWFEVPRESIVFVAFAGWDAVGAKTYGLKTFWVNRVNAPSEELGLAPDAVGGSLRELAKYVIA